MRVEKLVTCTEIWMCLSWLMGNFKFLHSWLRHSWRNYPVPSSHHKGIGTIPHFWQKSCGYVVKSHQLDWNANPIRFKKLNWKIHNSSLEWKQSNTRPSASCRIVFTLVNPYGFSNLTFWTGWDYYNPTWFAKHVVLVNSTCLRKNHVSWLVM